MTKNPLWSEMLSTLDAVQQIPDNELMPRSIYDVLTPSSSDL